MRKLEFGIVGAIAAVGALYYGLTVYPQQRFQTALDQSLGHLRSGYVASYKTAHYAWFGDRATLTGVAIRHDGAQAFDIAIDELVLDKPSLDLAAAWSKAAADPAALTPDQPLPVVGAVELRGLTVHGRLAVPAKDGATATEAVTATMETGHIDGARIYPWALLHAGVPTFGEAQAALAAAGQPPNPDDFLPMLRFDAAVMLGVGYDSYSFDAIEETVKIEPLGANPGTAFTYSIRRIAGGPYDRGVMKDAGFEGMTIAYALPLPGAAAMPGALTVPGQQAGSIAGTFNIDRATMTGLDMRRPFGQVLAGEKMAATMLDGLAIARIEYAGMTLQSGAATTPVALGSFSMSDIAFSDGMPVSARFAWDGVRVGRAQIPNPQTTALLDRLGLDTLTLSIGASYRWDLEQKHLAIRDATLKVDELGAVDLAADLSGIEIGGAWLSQARLAHALLHYHDATLTERIFRIAAGQTGADPAAFRQQAIALVQQRGAAFADNPAHVAMSKAIVAFLTAPGSLTIELSPPAPVPLPTLFIAGTSPPPQLQSLIGLSVSASP